VHSHLKESKSIFYLLSWHSCVMEVMICFHVDWDVLVLSRQREEGKENMIHGITKGLRCIVFADPVQR
jgi:hypothetical protein